MDLKKIYNSLYDTADLKLENVLFVGEELDERTVKIKGNRYSVSVPRDLRIKCTLISTYVYFSIYLSIFIHFQ